MEAIVIYLFKIHVVISLLFAVYWLIMKNEPFYKLNRFIMIAICIVAISLPLVPAKNSSWTTKLIETTAQIDPLPDIIFGVNHYKEAGLHASRAILHIDGKKSDILSADSLLKFLLFLYVSVIIILLIRLIKQIANLYYFIIPNARTTENGMGFFDLEHESSPFSFFGFIVIDRSQYDDIQFKQIFAHEKTHADQWHSIDILLSELVCILLWCNPLAKKLKGLMKLNLEYLADNEVLNKGFDKTNYQRMILQHYLHQQYYPLINTFISAPKLRIEKMNQKAETDARSGSESYKYLWIIPVIASAYLFINPSTTGLKNVIENGNSVLGKYTGTYEFESDKGSFIQILVKDDHLVMKTLWNDKKISLEQNTGSDFLNKRSFLPVHFSINFDGNVAGFTAFGKDKWNKVGAYTRIKRSDEVIVLSGAHVWSGTIDPWEKEKAYKSVQ